MRDCENCGAGVAPGSYELYDYCAACSKNLCGACMAKGCCGHTPAKSGSEADADSYDMKADLKRMKAKRKLRGLG